MYYCCVLNGFYGFYAFLGREAGFYGDAKLVSMIKHWFLCKIYHRNQYLLHVAHRNQLRNLHRNQC